jgi:hypothetical protein
MPLTIEKLRERFLALVPAAHTQKRAKLEALNAGSKKEFVKEASNIMKKASNDKWTQDANCCPSDWDRCKDGSCVPPGESCESLGIK